MLHCVEKRGYAYTDGLGPVTACGSGIRRAPGNPATSCAVRNPGAGTGGNAWPGFRGIA
jgi:hypothetical protein